MRIMVIAPHNDDEVLWNCYALIKHKPLVLVATISHRQGNNGLERLRESQEACNLLGCTMLSTGIYDDELTEQNLERVLKHFVADDLLVYAPALEGGHPDHDLVSKVATKLFPNIKYYLTYKQDDNKKAYKTTSGLFEHYPELMDLKQKALDCYKSQKIRPATQSFFMNTDKEYYE